MIKGREPNSTNEFKEASAEVMEKVKSLVNQALESIGGVENIFTDKADWPQNTNFPVWTQFRSTLTNLCANENLGTVFQIGMDKETHKVMSVTLMKDGGDLVVVDIE